ncbi:lantibiotic dehydratase [Virgisporangium ochraceum]|uniref:Lantibiotic dehydratase n=1 Tax=Virgisporangium ochraceum TaxID=65505 RepID=A0A8J4EFG7_9ACTN|nr:lantibiotic dehydratase [Virgisporangium ochraceum]GIJ72701.1 lantibiotic dehydratase [Virgisporangium ochraceum]
MAQAAHTVPLTSEWSVWRVGALRSAGTPFDWLDGLAVGAGSDGAGTAIGRALGEPRIVEALSWQNPPLVENWVGAYSAAARDGDPPRCTGKRAATIARYLQRYCAKNDTIGSFGPVAWARLDTEHDGVAVSGTTEIRHSTVYLEPWVLVALGARWRRDGRLLPHLPVRLHPAVWWDGRVLRLPSRAGPPVSGPVAAVLDVLRDDHRLTVSRTAAEAARRSGTTAAEVQEELVRLGSAGIVDIGFRIPMDESPAAHLREQVAWITCADTRAVLLAEVDEIERARDAVAEAVGDPWRLHEALSALSRTVSRLTGAAGHRSKDRARVGRTPAYVDCRRDLDVDIGRNAMDALRRPLGLVLDSARWLAAEVADAVEAALRVRHAELGRTGRQIRLSELYFSVADVLAGRPGTVIDEVMTDFHLRWRELLPDDDRPVVRLSSADIGSRAAALFPARAARWQGARYHSPDLMLSLRGDRPQWILGELHVALNTLESRVFHTQSDDPRWLIGATASDMAAGRVVALPPVDSPEVSPRTYPPLTVHVPGRYVYWSTGLDSGAPDGSPAWPAAALTVGNHDGRLVVEAPGGAWHAPVLEVLGDMLTALVVDRFRITAPRPSTPRVVLDDLVVQRRSWTVPGAHLAGGVRAVERIRADLAARGLPRHLFARTAPATKPFYVDLQAPLLVRNLIRACGPPSGTGDVRLAEMLPGPEDLWLTDPAGRRYTSELRMIAVDNLTGSPRREPWTKGEVRGA